jgi:hypothetical protein
MRTLRVHGLLMFAAACSTAAPPPPPAVSGMVVDDSNVVVANATVQVCNETLCTLGKTDATGSFAVSVPPGSGYHVIAHTSASDPRATSAGLAIVGDVDGAVMLQSPIVIPVVGALADVSIGAPSVTVEGVLIPAADWPAFGLPNETILAMWALAPWAIYDQGMTVTLANHFSLPAGSSAHVYAVNDTSAALLPPTVATVSLDGASLTGATVDRLTWLVLAVP